MNISILKAVLFFGITLISTISISQDWNPKDFEAITTRNIGPAGMSGRVTAIDVDPTDKNHIYIGAASGGVWHSNNGGISWKPIFDKQSILSIGALKINPANPDEIWVGTGEGNPRNSQNSGAGVYRSLDGGMTWQCMGLEDTKTIHRIAIDPKNRGTVYVGAQGSAWGDSEARGVYKTTDGGQSWEKILYVNDSTGVADMVMDPHNPQKILAAMWQFRRKPWFFHSGGAGSGLYMTLDGGDHWKKLGTKEGLPEGPLGRMGIAISHSNPDVIYAIIESEKEQALYKSSNGGHFWSKISTHKNLGNRPFYYSEIYVDPQQEDHLYSLWTYLSKSTDGGKHFSIIANYGNNVHPDHHALWIDPDNSDYIIDGNDGGLNISHDAGNTWRFVTNLPLGQFYHVAVDQQFPYRVYGGMQDNGSWVGPGFSLKRGGIRNSDWQEVFFGDGFDVRPKRDDPNWVYAMSQGGNIALIDKTTGRGQLIKPAWQDSIDWRFNWNAAMALDPKNNCGLYFGSQHVHYSRDCGKSWTVISPDLTSNDTSKQKQALSGGLTRDVTDAENYTTITVITPDPSDKNTIWVGTDDGRLQHTEDGGKNWTDIYPKLPGAPKGGYIPQITIPDTRNDEIWVVVNNYRQNDWKPYLYRSTDGGMTWKSMANNTQIDRFTCAVLPHPLEPNLVFLGTETGLYISTDAGRQWTVWDKDFPRVQVSDLAYNEAFDDLIIGTFGRSFWVIDELAPWRQQARTQFTTDTIAVFKDSDGVLANRRSYQGTRFYAQAEYAGQNKKLNPTAFAWINTSEDTVGFTKEILITITDANHDTIRCYTQKVKSKGLHRLQWNMQQDMILPQKNPLKKDDRYNSGRPGRTVDPGQYWMHVSIDSLVDTIPVTVQPDPRYGHDKAIQEQRTALYDSLEKAIEEMNTAWHTIKGQEKSLKILELMTENVQDTSLQSSLNKDIQSHRDTIKHYSEAIFGKSNRKGYYDETDKVTYYVNGARWYLNNTAIGVGSNTQQAAQMAIQKCETQTRKMKGYTNNAWQSFKTKIEDYELPLWQKME